MDNKNKNSLKIENEKNYTLKHRFAMGALVSLFLSFTVLLCGPLTLYIEGANDLWFTFLTLLKPVLLIFVIGFVVFTLLTSLPPKTFHKIICSLFFGIALGFYLQGTYMNISFGENGLNGSDIIWTDFTKYGLITTAIWLVCLIIPFILMIFVKKYYRTIIMVASFCFVLIQIITLTTFLLQNQEALTKVTYEVTDEGIYDLSKEENTIVFVLDSFDQVYLDEKLEEHPEYKEILQGFTEYNNDLASGARTIEGLPSMLTGEAYKKETTYTQYIDKIWNDEKAFTDMKNAGVDNRIFVETDFIGKNACNSINNIVDIENQVGSYEELTGTMYKYTMFAYSPFYAKRFFWLDTAEFTKALPDNAFSEGDVKFYNNWVDNGGFTYSSDYDKAFRFYIFEGAHTPYTMTKDIERSDTETSLSEQIDGCFNYLKQYFDNMKENGVYDKATIIITADHGDINPVPSHPILLVKKSGDNEGYTVNENPTSHFDLLPTMADSLGLSDYSKYASGKTFSDITKDENRSRYFYNNTGSNNNSRVDEFELAPGISAYDMDNTKLINSYKYKGGETNKYRLGTKLTFEIDATANVYCTEGFRQTTGWRTPMAGYYSKMEIPIESVPSNASFLNVHLGVQYVDTVTPVRVKANGTEIFDGTIDNENYKNEIWELKVPRELIGNDNTLTLEFEYYELDPEEMDLDINDRTLTVSLNTFMIDAE